MITALLILHGLVAVALLGAITHQTVSLFRRSAAHDGSFVDRYTGVNQKTFTIAVVVLYAVQVGLGAAIYPAYRLNVRIPFEEMSLGWAVGIFELKEHFTALGLSVLPYYACTWRTDLQHGNRGDRFALTLLLAAIAWFDFVVGHILNNIRGFG